MANDESFPLAERDEAAEQLEQLAEDGDAYVQYIIGTAYRCLLYTSFLGYYFDLSEDVFKFTDLNQYHLYKAAQDFETLKSGLGEYIKKVEQQRTKKTRTITVEYLRCRQEVQIANFLYLNGLDYDCLLYTSICV